MNQPAKKIAALFYGTKTVQAEEEDHLVHTDRVLVEIIEEGRHRHHYVPYSLDNNMHPTVLISSVEYEPDSPRPPTLVLKQFKGYEWRKLR